MDGTSAYLIYLTDPAFRMEIGWSGFCCQQLVLSSFLHTHITAALWRTTGVGSWAEERRMQLSMETNKTKLICKAASINWFNWEIKQLKLVLFHWQSQLEAAK